MKTVEEYMTLPYRMEITPDPDEGGFIVSSPELPGCLTSGMTADEAIQNSIEAKRIWFMAWFCIGC